MKNGDRISLLLANTNPLLDYPQPLPPNIIPVGGLQAKPAKMLPQVKKFLFLKSVLRSTNLRNSNDLTKIFTFFKDLQKILDDSKEEVIVFSLGTNMRSDKLTPERRKTLLNAFKQLKQTVL